MTASGAPSGQGPSGWERYRARHRAARAAAMRPLADSYPLSTIVMAISLGIVGALVFANLWAGLAGGAVSLLLGLWYWREGGRGRRLLAEFSRDVDRQ